MHPTPPLPWGSGLHITDTYREDIIDTRCGWQDASSLLMYSRWGIPRDSLKPHDVTQSMWYLFT